MKKVYQLKLKGLPARRDVPCLNVEVKNGGSTRMPHRGWNRIVDAAIEAGVDCIEVEVPGFPAGRTRTSIELVLLREGITSHTVRMENNRAYVFAVKEKEA